MILDILVANQKRSQERLVNRGTHSHHMLTMMLMSTLTQLVVTITAEILEDLKNPFGATLLILTHLLSYVNLLVHLSLTILMILLSL